ncbi:beta-galactosidase [Hymenobacter rubidus]|uniref:beta-galactosidase n=1 Tax=Hymenobacter rubidus TaxID=1441626 RepID=UPI00191E518F|nr:beta-galactosidase [Hymenobacter rubidus]
MAPTNPAQSGSWCAPTTPARKYTPGLDSVLQAGVLLNMYLFYGGTTRGFMNGANYNGQGSAYEPQVSSYDYDAPLDEAGNATPKFLAFREVIARYRPANQPLPPVPATTPADTYLALRAWGKGVVWANGHNLGRYWAIGPQQTLYLPAEWLKSGANDIPVLQLPKPQQATLSFLNHAILAELRPTAQP